MADTFAPSDAEIHRKSSPGSQGGWPWFLRLLIWLERRVVAAVNTAILRPHSFPSSRWSLSGFALHDRQRPDSPAVSFKKDIAPLLQRRCVACHGEESAKGGLPVGFIPPGWPKSRGERPAPIVAHKPGDPTLSTARRARRPMIGMPQKAEALPKNEIALIERWIKEGRQ